MSTAHPRPLTPGDDETTTAAAAVRRWLALGRDVVVRGEDGSGRSRVLGTVLAEASRRSTPAVLLRAAGDAPLAALRSQRSLLAERVPVTPAATTAWLAGELTGRRPLLLVDDLDLLDDASAEVVLQALRLTPAALVATTSADLTRRPRPTVAVLVAERAPAEVRLRPLGFRAMARLLDRTLHAPPDVALTSSITARSGGNPRVALALADAARFAGVAELVEGEWRKVGPLDGAPVDAVAHALLARLSPEEVAALELLAWTGPVPEPLVEHALDPGVVERLVERGRLRRGALGTSGTLTVVPPALADALRARLGPDRRGEIATLATALTGGGAGNRLGPLQPAGPLLGEVPAEEYRRWAADLTGLVHEQAGAEEAARRTAWRAAPTVAHAVAYLEVLLRRRDSAKAAAVFAGTERTGHEPVDELATLALDELRWAVWRGESRADLRARQRRDPVQEGLVRLLLGVRRAARDGEVRPVAEVLAEVRLPGTPPAPDGVLARWVVVAQVAGLIDAGFPARALEVAEPFDPGDPPQDTDHHLDGLRGEALLLLGRLDVAARDARRRLERALDDLDLLGIRVHSCVLAQALLLQGDTEAAWRVLGTSLRLGPGGPRDVAFYRRSLTVGAVLLSHGGAADVAQVLLDELARTSSGYAPAVSSLRAVGRAALADARGGEEDDDALWREGERYAAGGLRTSALVCWLARPVPYDVERLAVVRAAASACDVPLLDPWLRLHEALASGDQDALVAALALRPAEIAGLVRHAVGALDREHAGLVALAGLGAGVQLEEPQQEPLSAREREVASMAGAGMTNRQIADRLRLSIRTVENHVSNALHKLDLPSRSALAQWFADAARREDGDTQGRSPVR